MSHTKDVDAPPPYSPQTSSSPHAPSLLDQLSSTRTRHIESVINQHILPLIHERIAQGIAHTTIALLPSDTALPGLEEPSDTSLNHDDDSTAPVQVLGFASDTAPSVVQLEGHMNRTDFWRPPAVTHELATLLRKSLNPSPTTTEAGESETGASPVVQAAAPRSSRRRLLAKAMPSLGPELPSPAGNPEVGVRHVSEPGGVVAVRAALEDISLRTLSDFGLYNTVSKQCVIVQVEARC